ncbi:MAG: AI-2E family transporter [Terrimicrobiaceae bacterium]
MVVVLTLHILREGKDLFIPLVIALLGVYLIQILERWICSVSFFGRHIPGWLAMVLAFASVIGFGVLIFSIITDNAIRVAEYAPLYQQRFLQLQAELFQLAGIEQPPALREFLRDVNLAGLVTQVATNLAGLLKTAMLILVLGIFLFMEARFVRPKIAALFPEGSQRERVERLLKRVDGDIQTYFGVKTLVSLATALTSYIVMRILGLHFSEFWALLVFILNFIPTIGSILATILPALLALVQFNDTWVPFLVVAIGITAIQQFFGNFLEPNLMGMTLNLSPLVVVLSLILWGMVWGVVGMFLCVPITVIVVIILANFPGTSWVAILLSRKGELRL